MYFIGLFKNDDKAKNKNNKMNNYIIQYYLCTIDPPNEELALEGSNKDTQIYYEVVDCAQKGIMRRSTPDRSDLIIFQRRN